MDLFFSIRSHAYVICIYIHIHTSGQFLFPRKEHLLEERASLHDEKSNWIVVSWESSRTSRTNAADTVFLSLTRSFLARPTPTRREQPSRVGQRSANPQSFRLYGNRFLGRHVRNFSIQFLSRSPPHRSTEPLRPGGHFLDPLSPFSFPSPFCFARLSHPLPPPSFTNPRRLAFLNSAAASSPIASRRCCIVDFGRRRDRPKLDEF